MATTTIVETTVGINKVVQETLESGSGPYNNPLDIYSPGHKKYTKYVYGEKIIPDISGIITNIDLLREGNVLKVLQPEDAVRIFDPILTSDISIEPEFSGLSVNLRFSKYNVITTTNIFKNF